MKTWLLAALLCAGTCFSSEADLRRAITLHASFDKGIDADFARGDKTLFNAPSLKHPRIGSPGLPANGMVARISAGKFGGALQFKKTAPEVIFFEGAKNVDYQSANFDGTVSFWLNLTPDEDLAPGYSDPLQITPRAWDDGAFFVEFTKDEKPREFRLGAYADFKVWNPQNRPWDKIPFEEKPLIKVVNPPFKRGNWTHVVFTFANCNTGRKDAATRLYLNGELCGAMAPREQTFTWDLAQTKILLGISYIGLFDELSLFDRALSDDEVKELYQLPRGATAILQP